MEKEKLEKIKIGLLGLIVCLLICLLFVVSYKYKQDKKEENVIDSSNKNSEKYEKKEEVQLEENIKPDNDLNNEEKPIEKDDNTLKKEEQTSNNKKPESDTTNKENINQSNREEVIYNETDVISYFEDVNQSIEMYKSGNDETLKEKIKSKFITIVDFIFYDGTIKGYKFDELTEEAKVKVLALALKIDNKIDEYFPNYKENIKSKAIDFKEKVIILYLETTATLCEKVGSNACNEARENFKAMKESFGFTWDNLKKIASSSYTSLTTLLEEWYQSIK